MKDNFHSNQLTPEFIDKIKWEATHESLVELQNIKYNESESVKNKFNWQAKSQHNIKYIRIYLSIAAFIIPYYFLCSTKAFGNDFTPSLNGPYVATLLLSISIMYTFWSSLGGFVFDYCFGKECIAVRRYKNEPEWGYTLARRVGWVGVLTCIALAIVFSPMIFVGAGGFALLSFKMVNMKREPFYKIVPYNSILYINYFTKNDDLYIFFKEPVFNDINNDLELTFFEKLSEVHLFLHGRDKKDIIDFINKMVGYEVEYSESETYEGSPNLYDKARQLGVPLHHVTIDRETHEMVYSTQTEHYIPES